ncbi:hypothetical protein Trco_008225 [Trichoderma cornu-damae]|uniref:Uncharacterized protein n=1 Tax=Trichoderma cornu-damae TaxID=654480 RepID=A0A9P8QID6_9HYPO|nr:hypothetical protein Trco_008225 [Trichoderma cornu-damae]
MERDSRRGHGQWRGCFAFQNIVCDDESPYRHKRSGGLKMGHTYYYYYEVDGSAETFDTTMPYTTACPYMPGQTVNTLDVPVERTLRFRSASMNSIHPENFRTMDPATKFMKPLPPTPLPSGTANRRAQSASISRPSPSSSRSQSPASWKRFFTRKSQSSSDGPRRPSAGSEDSTFTIYDNVITVSSAQDTRCGRHASSLSEGARSRDISPGSLSRILREGGHAPRRPSHAAQLSPLTIPDDVIEEDEDDENFATSAISESLPFVTVLSPPPFQRSSSSESIKHDAEAGTSTAAASKPQLSIKPPSLDRSQPISAVTNETSSAPHWPTLTKDKVTTSPFHEDFPMSFYDDEDDDDDDVISSNDDDAHFPPIPISKSRLHSFRGYSLPRHIEETKDAFAPHQTFATPISPNLVPSGSNLLDTHVEAGLDDFVSELGWIVGAIGTTNGH